VTGGELICAIAFCDVMTLKGFEALLSLAGGGNDGEGVDWEVSQLEFKALLDISSRQTYSACPDAREMKERKNNVL
jgi:hypothetical protein